MFVLSGEERALDGTPQESAARTQSTWLKWPFWFKQSLANSPGNWTLLSSFIVLKWQFPLLAGNCLPYHQPCSYSLRPTSVLELTWFYAHCCRESVQLVRLPGGPTTDHPWSLPASPEASDEDDVLRRCPLSEHSTILSVTPPAQQISGCKVYWGVAFSSHLRCQTFSVR